MIKIRNRCIFFQFTDGELRMVRRFTDWGMSRFIYKFFTKRSNIERIRELYTENVVVLPKYLKMLGEASEDRENIDNILLFMIREAEKAAMRRVGAVRPEDITTEKLVNVDDEDDCDEEYVPIKCDLVGYQ